MQLKKHFRITAIIVGVLLALSLLIVACAKTADEGGDVGSEAGDFQLIDDSRAALIVVEGTNAGPDAAHRFLAHIHLLANQLLAVRMIPRLSNAAHADVELRKTLLRRQHRWLHRGMSRCLLGLELEHARSEGRAPDRLVALHAHEVGGQRLHAFDGGEGGLDE